MKEILPDVKLIVILRNPVDRAYSQYHHTMRMNKETLPFEKAIEAEEERCAGERERLVKDPYFVPRSYQAHSYIARGPLRGSAGKLVQILRQKAVFDFGHGRLS